MAMGLGGSFQALAQQATQPQQANRFSGRDLMSMMSGAETIKAQRLKNEAATKSMADDDAARERLRQRRRILAMNDNMPKAIAAMKKAGDFEGAFQVAEQHRKTLEADLGLVGTLSELATNQATYEKLRGDLVTRGVIDKSELPAKWSSTVWAEKRKQYESRIARIRNSVSRVDEKGRVMLREERLNPEGKVVEQGPEFMSERDRAGVSAERVARIRAATARMPKPSSMRAADSNAIRKAVERMFEPMTDPATGEMISPLKRDDARKVQVLTDAASRIWASAGGAMPHETAVAQALRMAPQLVGGIGEIDPGGGPLKLRRRPQPEPQVSVPPLRSPEEIRKQRGVNQALRPQRLAPGGPKF